MAARQQSYCFSQRTMIFDNVILFGGILGLPGAELVDFLIYGISSIVLCTLILKLIHTHIKNYNQCCLYTDCNF